MIIGFLGLGTMGKRMANRLQAAGHKLVVHDLVASSAESLLQGGAEWAATPRALAKKSDVVMTSLPGPREVESVAYGEEGLLAGVRSGTAYFDFSTNSLATVRKLHGAFEERKAFMLDAPISGGVRGAQEGKLALWIGGDREVYDRFKPVLDVVGNHVRHVGDIGTGTITKLVANSSSYAMLCCIAEAFTMGVKAGAEPLTLWEAIRQGAVGRRRSYDGLIDQFLPGIYEPPAFRLPLAHKDVSLALDIGRDVGVPMKMISLCLADLSEALNNGWGDLDARTVMLLQQKRAGVSIGVDPEKIQEVLMRDPPAPGDPKASQFAAGA